MRVIARTRTTFSCGATTFDPYNPILAGMTDMCPIDPDLADTGRLRWRCRRGTRELDALLGWWLEERFPHADAAQREDFAAMLDAPDPDLWNWLIGQEPAAPRFARIVDEIRFRDRI